jgi:hypothetical protein
VDKKWQYLFSRSECPSMEDLKLYHYGRLPEMEQTRMEHHLLECEMCNDVLEGYLLLDDDQKLTTAENEITSRLEKQLYSRGENKRTLISFQRMAIAASVFLVIGFSVFFLLKQKKIAPSLPVAWKNEKTGKTLGDTLLIAQNEPLKQKYLSGSNNGVSTESKASLATPAASNKIYDVVEAEDIPAEEPSPVLMEMASQNRSMIVKPDGSQIPLNNGSYLMTGKVTDATTGEGLPGVAVSVQGTRGGVITDVDGRFHMEVSDPQAALSFSYIGYVTEYLKLGPGKENMIAMTPDINKLDEVVVIGYGTTKKREVTGSISMMDSKLKRTPGVQVQIDSLKKAIIIHPKIRETYLELSKKYLEENDNHHSLETLEQLKGLTETHSQHQIDEIIVLVQQNNLSKALKKLKKIK